MSAVAVAAVTCAVALSGCGARPAASSAGPSSGTGSGSPGQVVTVPASGSATAVPAPGAGTVPPGTVTAPPRRIVAGRSGQVRLTQSDNGVTVVLRPGQRVVVVLGGQGPGWWDRPRVTGSEPAVLRLTSASGGYPQSGPALASFLAIRPGKAAITSMSDAACLHTVPACEIAQQVWQVQVIVRPV